MFDKLLEYTYEIEEGRKEELQKQFVDSGKVSKEIFDFFVKEDPTGKNKYLQWMLKQYIENPTRKTHIRDVVNQFDQLVSSKKIKKERADIFRYDLDSLDQEVSKSMSQKTKSQIKSEEKAEAQRITETDRYLIVSPKTHKSSCFYGANTKWCISGKTSNYWDQYWRRGVNFYIVVDKKENKKYAVAVSPSGEKETYDEEDNQIDFDELKNNLGIR